MSLQADTFLEWLDEQENLRNWSDYEVAKNAGISHSVISRARSGIPPKWDACLAIAKALDASPVLVFRKAGLLPPQPETDEQIEQILHEAAQLTKAEQEELLAFINMKRNLRKER